MKSLNTMLRTVALVIAVGLYFATETARAGISLTTVHTFDGTNGSYPRALIQGADGNIYGTTWFGGTESAYAGTVFKLTPDGILTTLASFDGTNYDLGEALTQASDGNVYGSTFFGGPGGWQGDGTLFKLTTNGVLTSFHLFDGTNGSGPQILFQGQDGNFYGTTLYGGIGYQGLGTLSGGGTVFKIDTNGVFTPLAFFDGTNGADPFHMIQGRDGNFYGVTAMGGNGFSGFGFSTEGQGTVFKLTPEGTITPLVLFQNTNGDYTFPLKVIQGRDNNLYGVTALGGTYDLGTVFRVTLDGVLTTLWSFDGTNGALPMALVESPDGNFYGATEGGSAGEITEQGTLFSITPQGQFTFLGFLASSNGVRPQVGFIQGADGNFYGASTEGAAYNDGAIFRLSVPLPPVFKAPIRNGGLLNLSWTSAAGQSYQLQHNSDLSSTNWNNLGSVILATNGVMSASDLIGSDLQRFYRVGVLP